MDEIEIAYNATLINPYLELGFENDKSYSLTPQNRALFKKADLLKGKREEVLYYRIFCFSQVVYSLKDYLNKIYPEKKAIIESFFSDKPEGGVSRKQLSNDLKHNPSKDMKFGFIEKGRKTELINRSKITTINYNFNWHYEGFDSIDHCKSIYKEILLFLRDEFKFNNPLS